MEVDWLGEQRGAKSGEVAVQDETMFTSATLNDFNTSWPKPVGDKKVTGEIEITGGKNLLLAVDELNLWALISTLKMMIDDHQFIM